MSFKTDANLDDMVIPSSHFGPAHLLTLYRSLLEASTGNKSGSVSALKSLDVILPSRKMDPSSVALSGVSTVFPYSN